MRRREDLSTPRRRRLGSYDREAFGNLSEGIARFIGTARFLVYQSVFIAAWLTWNYLAPARFRFDDPKQGLVRLTLILSLQAAYAAPLILLAQNRQEERDREQLRQDRTFNARTQADTEFLARELAGVRLALSDVVTGDDLKAHTAELRDLLDEFAHRSDAAPDTRRNRRVG